MSAQRSPLQREMQRGGETVFNALIQRGSVGARRTGEARTHGQTTPPPPQRAYGTATANSTPNSGLLFAPGSSRCNERCSPETVICIRCRCYLLH